MRELGNAPPEGLEQLRADCRFLELDQRVLRAAGVTDAQPHNPSVVMHDGELLVSVRVLTGGVSITRNILGTLSGQGELEDQREMRDLVQKPARNKHVRSYGYEDLRLFVRHGRLWGSATVCDRTPDDVKAKIAVLELDQVGNFVACHVQPSDRIEKNWMPVLDPELAAGDGALRFVYGLEPTPAVVTFHDGRRQVWPEARLLPNTVGTLRGSSQVLRWKQGYLCVVHQVHAGRPTYVHRFVTLTPKLQIDHIGTPFYFRELGIEFCCGAAMWGSHLVLSFGVRDREAWVALVEPNEVERLLA